MCKFESGLTSKKCKLILGRDKFLCQPVFGTFAKPLIPAHNLCFAKEPKHPCHQNNYILYQYSQVKADNFPSIGNLFKLLFVSLLSG